jgi:hypothetical protein
VCFFAVWRVNFRLVCQVLSIGDVGDVGMLNGRCDEKMEEWRIDWHREGVCTCDIMLYMDSVVDFELVEWFWGRKGTLFVELSGVSR